MTEPALFRSIETVFEDKSVRTAGLNVVAAKLKGEWIVRALSPFSSVSELRKHVEVVVGTIDENIEWSEHHYEGLPHYYLYGEGDLPYLDWSSGVFIFRHKEFDMYGPAERIHHPSFNGHQVGINAKKENKDA